MNIVVNITETIAARSPDFRYASGKEKMPAPTFAFTRLHDACRNEGALTFFKYSSSNIEELTFFWSIITSSLDPVFSNAAILNGCEDIFFRLIAKNI